jgi:hypothetical protein
MRKTTSVNSTVDFFQITTPAPHQYNNVEVASIHFCNVLFVVLFARQPVARH